MFTARRKAVMVFARFGSTIAVSVASKLVGTVMTLVQPLGFSGKCMRLIFHAVLSEGCYLSQRVNAWFWIPLELLLWFLENNG
jgi:hypothetical protein